MFVPLRKSKLATLCYLHWNLSGHVRPVLPSTAPESTSSVACAVQNFSAWGGRDEKERSYNGVPSVLSSPVTEIVRAG